MSNTVQTVTTITTLANEMMSVISPEAIEGLVDILLARLAQCESPLAAQLLATPL